MSLTETLSRAAELAPFQWKRAPRRLRLPEARPIFIGVTLLLTAAITASFAWSITHWTPLAFAAVPLAALTGAWISGGAATALIGLSRMPAVRMPPPQSWTPDGRTAILVTLCKEDPAAVARYLADLRRSLDRQALSGHVDIHVLSDTPTGHLAEHEAATLAQLTSAGDIRYRRRDVNTNRKPGNIADWLHAHGGGYDYMLILDADSRMAASRIRHMIRQIEQRPRTGLLQAGMGLVPGSSRFGRHQRVAVRLMSHNFGRGMAAWAGEASNYWGHNAILRTEAFRAAARLPVLSGQAPFGGPVLSHDFIEAAWMRRAGWAIELDPEMHGSAEDAPQSMDEFHKRDRRWCQGNLQHLRLLTSPGLHPLSRFHLAAGVISYLAAPIWLLLVILIASGAVEVAGALPFALVAIILLTPKLCALALWLEAASTLRRQMVIWRAWIGELLLSTLIAPIMMIRQTGAVGAVLMGRDCGWKSSAKARIRLPRGLPEAAAGAALLGIALVSGPGASWWLAPLIAPLLAAPVIVPVLDARPAA